jgi:hypothetical protein
VFTRLVRKWKLRQAERIAKPLVLTLRDCLENIRDEEGGLSEDIRDDEFVLIYIYGMVAGSLARADKVNDSLIAALTLRQTFEHVFGQGQSRAELCADLAKCRDGDFKYAAKLGYSAVQKHTVGSEVPTGLIEHLRSYGVRRY